MNKIIRTKSGRTYKVVITAEHKCKLVLVEKPRPTGPMFIDDGKVYVLPDAKIEYMYTKDDIATILYSYELNKYVGIKGSRHNFYLEKVHGRMYRVYKLY